MVVIGSLVVVVIVAAVDGWVKKGGLGRGGAENAPSEIRLDEI
jgi:hypothetical protein